MSITFPCRITNRQKGITAPPGTPTRAAHCRCDAPLVIDGSDTCTRCGRLTKRTIDDTWRRRAAQLRA